MGTRPSGPDRPVSLHRKREGYTIQVNGKDVDFHVENGYAVILRKWKKGDTVQLDFPMDVRRVEARVEVEDDRGKAAIERGPIVYCIEDKDQPDSLISTNSSYRDAISATYAPDMLNGIVTLEGTAQAVGRDGRRPTCRSKPFLIPYGTTVARHKWPYGFPHRRNMPVPNLCRPSLAGHAR